MGAIKLGTWSSCTRDLRSKREAAMPDERQVRRRPSEARELVDQIFARSNPVMIWLQNLEALRAAT